MKTNRKYRKNNTDYGTESRKRKDLIINFTVLSIAGVIALFLISKVA